MSIYDTITPTYLYIKQHSVTKLKYFGKTTQADPIKYLGSGTQWRRHIKKHGKQFVETIWLSDLYFDTSISEVALHFSNENNIVESKKWANLVLEDGIHGFFNHAVCTETFLSKYGYANPFQIQAVKDKIKSEMLINTGYDNPSKDPKIKQIKQETALANYGVLHPLQSKKVCDKIKSSNLKKYGYEHVLQVPEIKQKGIDTCNATYGVNNVSQVQAIKDKKAATCFANYGVYNSSQIKFMSIIETKKTYSKCIISRIHPELKQYY